MKNDQRSFRAIIGETRFGNVVCGLGFRFWKESVSRSEGGQLGMFDAPNITYASGVLDQPRPMGSLR